MHISKYIIVNDHSGNLIAYEIPLMQRILSTNSCATAVHNELFPTSVQIRSELGAQSVGALFPALCRSDRHRFKPRPTHLFISTVLHSTLCDRSQIRLIGLSRGLIEMGRLRKRKYSPI